MRMVNIQGVGSLGYEVLIVDFPHSPWREGGDL